MHTSLRLVIVLVLAALLAKVLWDMWSGGRRRPIVAGALLAGVVVLGALEHRAQTLERKLGAAASQLAGRDVEVRCEGFFGELVDIGPELGTVRFDADGVPADRTDLVRAACQDLRTYLGGDREPRREIMFAVHTLAHEAVHLRGVRNEAETECISVQLNDEMARLLGANEAEARALATLYWREIYPQMPSNYRTAECRPGGPFDVNPETAEWP